MGVMQVMRSLLMAQPHRESIVGTDGIATFDDDFKGLMKLTVPFSPMQDLHGMPNPYPAGASVNLIPDGTDTSNGYVSGCYLRNDNTTTANTNYYISEYFGVDENTTYTYASRGNTEVNPSICFYDENKQFISGINSNKRVQTFTPPTGAVYARASQTTYSYQATNPTGAAFQLEIGGTATEYRRYSNICPITGWSKCGIHQSGVNFVTNQFIRRLSRRSVEAGTGKIESSNYFDLLVYAVPRKRLVLYKNGTSSRYDGFANSPDLVVGDTCNRPFYTRWSEANAIDSKYAYAYLCVGIGGMSPGASLSLENYNRVLPTNEGNSLFVSFTDPSTGDPMTVYCGTLTLNEDGSGTLINHGMFVNLQGRTWYKVSGTNSYFYTSLGNTHFVEANENTVFSTFPTIPVFLSNTNQGAYVVWSSESSRRQRIVIRWNQSGASTAEEFKEYIDALPECNAVISKITADVYSFNDVGQLKSFIGQNNVWTDLNGDPTVGYWKHG